jgi:hypothetical protein
MKKRYVLVLAIVMALPAVAMAGLKVKSEVELDADGRWARGSIGSARNSRDSNQYISCQFWGEPEQHTGICHARDATENYGACLFINNEHLARVISTISDSSMLAFNWNQNEECTWIYVNNGSGFEPRK